MVTPIHDFIGRLSDTRVVTTVADGMAALRSRLDGSDTVHDRQRPRPGPISINLDLTTACNYACDHCIDAEVLNDGQQLKLDDVLATLSNLAERGLKSVILIGGGEPTLYHHFEDVVREIKLLGLECGIVTNGSNSAKLTRIAKTFTDGDWVRVSLDAATDETFRAMHRPRTTQSLTAIYRGAGEIKTLNTIVSLGLSFIVSWRGLFVASQRGGLLTELSDNVEEMAAAAIAAKRHGFDYVSYKPMLSRDRNGHEVIRMPSGKAGERLRARIEDQLCHARGLEDDVFSVHESLNLGAVIGTGSRLTIQPHRCYMHLFRQVITPSGVFGCPAYRGNGIDRIGDASAYASAEGTEQAITDTHDLIGQFDVSVECREIECIYNSTNWWLDSLYKRDADPTPRTTRQSLFL